MYYKRGFTLVEMLFVVIIAAGVMAFAFPSYRAARERAKFHAASGQLLALGNAVESITADLTLQGLDIKIGDSSPHFYEYTGEGEAIPSGKTLLEVVEDAGSGAAQEQKMLKLLRGAGYLKNYSSTGYTFYVLSNEASISQVGPCTDGTNTSSPLNGTLVACMVKSNFSDNDCFGGARYYKGGKFQTIRGANCKSGS